MIESSFPSCSRPFSHLLPLPTWDVSPQLSLPLADWPFIHCCRTLLFSSSSSAVSEPRGCSPQAGVPASNAPQKWPFELIIWVLRPLAREKYPSLPFLLQWNLYPRVCVCVCGARPGLIGWHPMVGWGERGSPGEKQIQRRKGSRIPLDSLGDCAQSHNRSHGGARPSAPPTPATSSTPPTHFSHPQVGDTTLAYVTAPPSREAELGSHLKRQPCCYYKNRGKNESIATNPLQKP